MTAHGAIGLWFACALVAVALPALAVVCWPVAAAWWLAWGMWRRA